MAIDTPGFINFTNNTTCSYSQPTIISGSGGGGGGPGGGGDCDDGPDDTINLDCQSTTCVTLTVCGGLNPYTWSTDNGTLNTTVGQTVILCAPANSGSGVAGNAYTYSAKYVQAFCTVACAKATYKCDGTLNTTLNCSSGGCEVCFCHGASPGTCNPPTCVCSGFLPSTPAPACRVGLSAQCGFSACGTVDLCVLAETFRQCFRDARTAGMISGGCNPCAISMEDGATVTVTDVLGNSTSVFIDSI
jgi:hypothetical protein